MLDFVRRNRILVASLCCLALAAVLVASTATGRGRADAFGRLLLDVMAPLQRGGSYVTRAVEGVWRDAAGLFRRRAEIDAMQYRITQLEEQTVRLEEVEREN